MTLDTRFALTRGSFELNVDLSFKEGEVVAVMSASHTVPVAALPSISS